MFAITKDINSKPSKISIRRTTPRKKVNTRCEAKLRYHPSPTLTIDPLSTSTQLFSNHAEIFFMLPLHSGMLCESLGGIFNNATNFDFY
jgi:hypothetical protein